jgi:hypothetical protein
MISGFALYSARKKHDSHLDQVFHYINKETLTHKILHFICHLKNRKKKYAKAIRILDAWQNDFFLLYYNVSIKL